MKQIEHKITAVLVDSIHINMLYAFEGIRVLFLQLNGYDALALFICVIR